MTVRTGLVLATLALAGCWETSVTAESDATALRILAEARSENYSTSGDGWRRAPYFETRRTSLSPHGAMVDLWVTSNVVDAFEENPESPDWPVGSVAIKHGYDENENLQSRAIIVRQADGWFFAALTADDQIVHSGQPEMCLSCHGGAVSYLRFIDFPPENGDF